jgi:hypothetical protein
VSGDPIRADGAVEPAPGPSHADAVAAAANGSPQPVPAPAPGIDHEVADQGEGQGAAGREVRRRVRLDRIARWSSGEDRAEDQPEQPQTPDFWTHDPAGRAPAIRGFFPPAAPPEAPTERPCQEPPGPPAPVPAGVTPPAWPDLAAGPRLDPDGTEDAGGVGAIVEDHALRPDELAVLRARAWRRTGFGEAAARSLGVAWPPSLAALLTVAVVALLAFGFGTIVGDAVAPAPRPDPGAAAPPAAASTPTRPAPLTAVVPPSTSTARARAPEACLDAARLGDETISLLTAGVRDRRLDTALGRYAAASRRCRAAASATP